MASIRKRGETFTITAYMGYDDNGRQRKKTTTFRPPSDVTPGKAEKLAKSFAATWEDKIQGYVSLDENRTFAELAEWYFSNVAPYVLKPNVLISHKGFIYTYVMPSLARKKLKDITPVMLDALFQDLRQKGRVHPYTYKLIDPTVIEAEKQRQTARDTGLGERTIYLYRKGGNAKKEHAETIAAYLGKNLEDVFTPVSDDKSLSVNTVLRIKHCVSAIFSSAVKKEVMRRNPALNTIQLERPRLAMSYLDEQQALKLLDTLENQTDYQFKTMIMMLLFTGMRGGELLGLLWDNVDFTTGVVYIRHTLSYIRTSDKKNKHVLQTPKTPGSERYIVIPPSLVEMLKEHKRRQNERRAALGPDYGGRETVFTTPMGEYYYIGYLNVKFKELARKIGLPDGIHLHSLRHTTASLLINSDIPAKVISEQLGHSSTAVTQDIYAHIFASSKIKAMQALELKLKTPENSDEQ